MAPRTSNLYGKIIISKRAIRQVVEATAAEAYGVACVGRQRRTKFGASSAKLGTKIANRLGVPVDSRGSSVSCEDNRIEISVKLYLKFGVTIDPVIESIRRAIKYNVETFTGMTVDCVNIDVLGIKN